MRHRLSGLSNHRLTAKVREMSTPPTPIRAWSALPLPFYNDLLLRKKDRKAALVLVFQAAFFDNGMLYVIYMLGIIFVVEVSAVIDVKKR